MPTKWQKDKAKFKRNAFIRMESTRKEIFASPEKKFPVIELVDFFKGPNYRWDALIRQTICNMFAGRSFTLDEFIEVLKADKESFLCCRHFTANTWKYLEETLNFIK